MGCAQQRNGTDTGALAASAPAVRLTAPDASGILAVEVAGLEAPVLVALEASGLSREQWEQVLRVAAQPAPGTDGANTLPVLGSYAVDDGAVRFTPMFPFDPGRSYVVIFDPSPVLDPEDELAQDQRIVSVVGLPARETVPSTFVEEVYPTTSVLPENLLKFYVHFSAPMSAVDGLPYVRLLDESGDAVEGAFLPLLGVDFWDRGHRRFTVFFDPGRIKQGLVLNDKMGRSVTDGATYTLVIDEAWPDADGTPLGRGFQKRFRVGPPDTEPIDPSAWSLQAPQAGTRGRLVVSFPEPLDHGLLQWVLSVTTGAGDRVEGESEVSDGEMQWAFVPGEPWAAGDYLIVALSILEDLAGNRIGTPFEISGLLQVAPTVDLDSVEVPFSVVLGEGRVRR